MVQLRIKLELALGDDVELCRPRTRDEFWPLADSGLANVERPAQGSTGPKMSNCVGLLHIDGQYPMGDRPVNDGTPIFATSFAAMDNETKGDRIKRLREARALTQPALARLLISMGGPATLSKAAVAKWENGDTQNMQNETFVLLCKALGTDPEYILWGQDRAPTEPQSGSTLRASRRR